MDMKHEFDVDLAFELGRPTDPARYPESLVIAVIMVGAWLPMVARGISALIG